MMSCIYYFIIAELIQANMLLPVTHSTYNLSEPRIHASGVNLDDHRMLVMGGKGLNNLSSAMDVFDTRIQKWTTHTLPEKRGQQGGPTAGHLQSLNLVFYGGGLGNGISTNGTVDLIDSLSLEVVMTPALSIPRDILSCAGVRNTFICAGGQNKSLGDDISFTTDVFTVSQRFENGTLGKIHVNSSYKLSVGRKKLSGAGAGDLIAFAMGYSDVSHTEGYSDAVDIFNVSSQTWRASTLPSSNPRMYGTAISCGGFIIFAGGQVGGGRSLSVDALDATTGEWVSHPGNLSVARSLVSSACLDGRYAVFAGGQIPPSPVVDIVDTRDWKWSLLPNLNTPRSALAGANSGKCVMFSGGSAPGTYDTDVYCLPSMISDKKEHSQK